MIAALTAAPLLGAAPASAQWFEDSPMSPQAIARIVTRQGYAGFSPPRLTGDVYIVQAIDDGGARVRLVIDAYDGRILRPVRAVEELLPQRPIHRVRPRDYASPEFEYEVEREPVERFSTPRQSRDEELLPPRSIGRGRALEEAYSPETHYEREREPIEPYRAPALDRAQRPASPEPTLRNEPNGTTARVEPPARQPATQAPARPRVANRPAPAAPAPVVEAPKPDRPADAKPTTTAAVPAPALKEPVTPTPVRTEEPAKPAANRPAKASEPQQPAATATAAGQPAATASTAAAPKVRVIEGVTPITPQDPATAGSGSSSKPETVAQ